MNDHFLSQYVIIRGCAWSLCMSVFICWVCFFFFPSALSGERGTSFGDKRLNMMNECLLLPIWPARLVSVVKITAMALWSQGRFFPVVINWGLGKISSPQRGSSVIWGSHFCCIFPAMLHIFAVITSLPHLQQGLYAPRLSLISASGILRAVHPQVGGWGALPEEPRLDVPTDVGGWRDESFPEVVFSIGEL